VKEGSMTKLAPRGHATLKMHNGFTHSTLMEIKSNQEIVPSTSAPNNNNNNNVENQIEQIVKGINLFADSNVPSFFR
jgi:hypothetical protein